SAAATNDPMTGVDNVPIVYEAMASYGITAATIALVNNLRTRLQVGTLGAISLGSGTIAVTGTVQAYFNTADVMNKYLNFANSGLAFRFQDTLGNVMVVDLP